MRVAIPTWNGRISPVFDVASRLLVVDVNGAQEISRTEAAAEGTDPALRARRVAGLGVNVLICGAISMPLEAMLASEGVRVLARTCGPVEEVLEAFLAGRLTEDIYRMPGCRRQQRRLRRRLRRRGGGSEFTATEDTL